MARTALGEQFGVVRDAVISADYNLPIASGVPGSARLIVLRPNTASLDVRLPTASYSHAGGLPQYTIINRGAHTFTVRDANDTSIGTVAVNEAAQVFLIEVGAIGTWFMRTFAGVVEAAPTSNQVAEFEIVLGSINNFNLRTYVNIAFGYDGSMPARVRLTFEPRNSFGAVCGATATNRAAFDTGTFPGGSSLFLTLEQDTYIVGRGGDGGRGGDVPPGLLAANGGAGGTALVVGMDTVLVNYGKIQGGGGGGAGGPRSGDVGGPGGGGGAGYIASAGGVSGNGTVLGGAGGPGGIDSPGYGGGLTIGQPAGLGGSGGGPGAAGSLASPSGGLVGAAGNAIVRGTSFTLTKEVAGTITGPEITV